MYNPDIMRDNSCSKYVVMERYDVRYFAGNKRDFVWIIAWISVWVDVWVMLDECWIVLLLEIQLSLSILVQLPIMLELPFPLQ